MDRKKIGVASIIVSATILISGSAFAQGGVPLPGAGYGGTDNGGSAPVPGNGDPVQSAGVPLPGNGAAPKPGPSGSTKLRSPKSSSGAGYGALPLSAADAKESIVEMRNIVLMSKPQEALERVGQMGEWLADIADAHNKMANVFSKQESTKAQASSERQAAATFSQLKREVELIKAEILISQKRYPEALAPLVNIVVAEPTSATGKKAYEKLKDLGFSEDSALTVAGGDEQTTEEAGSGKTASGKNSKSASSKSVTSRNSAPASLDGRKSVAVAAPKRK